MGKMQKCLKPKAELPFKRWLGFFYLRKEGKDEKVLVYDHIANNMLVNLVASRPLFISKLVI